MARIAVFDSGVGGLGVMEHIRQRAPWADIVYLGDHAYGPYGERTIEEVRARTSLLATFLRSADVDLIVIACNSASAAALRHLRVEHPDIDFVGMEPAVKPAAEATETGTIAVVATGATFQGDLFADLVGRFGGDVEIIEQACPGLAAAIEEGSPVDELLDRYLAPIAASDADVLVLGCTHYPLIEPEFRRRLPGVRIIDPAPSVASRVLDVARDRGLDLKGSGHVELWSTGTTPRPHDEWDWHPVDVAADAAAAIRVAETTVSVVTGDITTMTVDAIVNAANIHLAHGGGVAAAIVNAGGPVVDAESRAWIEANGPLEPGVAALTSAGSMPSSYVIHTAGPVYAANQDNEVLLTTAVLAALAVAEEIGVRTLALPAVSAGVFGYPPDEATALIVGAVLDHLSDRRSSLGSVRLVGYDEAMAMRFADAIRSVGLVDGA
ncbi:MAG: glutamate racemase [Acidimicrobiia bacterium]|nr:glutamate racemase [Acidimicrobiia bacterium]